MKKRNATKKVTLLCLGMAALSMTTIFVAQLLNK